MKITSTFVLLLFLSLGINCQFPTLSFDLKRDVQNLDTFYPNKTVSPISSSAILLYTFNEYHQEQSYSNYYQTLSNNQFGGEDVTINFWLKLENTTHINWKQIFDFAPNCDQTSSSGANRIRGYFYKPSSTTTELVVYYRAYSSAQSKYIQNESRVLLTQDLTLWNYLSMTFKTDGSIEFLINNQAVVPSSSQINEATGIASENYKCVLLGSFKGAYIDNLQVFKGILTDSQQLCLKDNSDCIQNCPVGQYEDNTGTCQQCPSNCATCRYGTYCESCKANTNVNGADLNCSCKEDYFFNGTTCEEITTLPRQAFALKRDIQNLDIHYPNKTQSPASNSAISLEAYNEYHQLYDMYNFNQDLTNITFGGNDVTVNFWLKMDNTNSHSFLEFNNDPQCRSAHGTISDKIDFNIFEQGSDLILEVDVERYRTVRPTHKDTNEYKFILTQDVTEWNFFSVISYSNGTITAFANSQQLTVKSYIINQKFGLRNIDFTCSKIGWSYGEYIDQIQVFDGALTKNQITSAYTNPNLIRNCNGNTFEDNNGVCQTCPSNCASCLYGTHCETCISDPYMNGPDLNCSCKQDYTFNGTACVQISEIPRMAFDMKKDIQNIDTYYPNKEVSPVSQSALVLYAEDAYGSPFDYYNYRHDLTNIYFGGDDVTINFWLRLDSNYTHGLIEFNNDPQCKSAHGTVTDKIDFVVSNIGSDTVLNVEVVRQRTVSPINRNKNYHYFFLDNQNLQQWNYFSTTIYGNGTVQAYGNNQRLNLRSSSVDYKLGVRDINFTCAQIGESIGDAVDQLQVFNGSFTTNQRTDLYNNPNLYRECPVGQYQDSQGVCKQCPANCATCRYQQWCDSCNPDPNADVSSPTCACNEHYFFNGTACEEITTYPDLIFDVKRDVPTLDEFYPNKTVSPVSSSAFLLYYPPNDIYYYHQNINNTSFGGGNVTFNFWMYIDNPDNYKHLFKINNDPHCKTYQGTSTDSIYIEVSKIGSDYTLRVRHEQLRTEGPANENENGYTWIISQNISDLEKWNFVSFTLYSNGTASAEANGQDLVLRSQSIQYYKGVRDVNFTCTMIGKAQGSYLDQFQVYNGLLSPRQQNCLQNNPNCPCIIGEYKDNAGNCQQCSPQCATCLDGNSCETCKEDPNSQGPEANCACNPGFEFNGSICVEIPCGTYEYRDFNNICQPCVSPCKTCQSASVCDSCVDSFFFDNALSICSPCSYPCGNCSNSTNNCDSCVDNFNRQGPANGCACDPLYQDNGSNCELIPCGANEYRHTDNTCQPCQSPCQTCSSETVCESCVEQYYFDQSSNSCIACNYPCQNCSSATTCTSCASTANRKGPEFGCVCETGYEDNGISCDLIPCTEFEYRDIDNICQPCQSPCKTCQDQNTCSSCIDEYYFDSTTSQCNLCVYPCKLCTSATQCSTCVNTENRVSPSTGDCDCIPTYYDNGSICEKISCHSDEILGSDGFCEKKRLDQEKFNLFIENEAQNKKFCISSNGFSVNEANVACKSLNYDSVNEVYSDQLCQSCDFNSLFYALTCTGNEKHWSDCQVTQINNQGSNECVAISCQRL